MRIAEANRLKNQIFAWLDNPASPMPNLDSINILCNIIEHYNPNDAQHGELSPQWFFSIDPSLSDEQQKIAIIKKYREYMLKSHPDRFGEQGVLKNELTKLLNVARDRFLNPIISSDVPHPTHQTSAATNCMAPWVEIPSFNGFTADNHVSDDVYEEDTNIFIHKLLRLKSLDDFMNFMQECDCKFPGSIANIALKGHPGRSQYRFKEFLRNAQDFGIFKSSIGVYLITALRPILADIFEDSLEYTMIAQSGIFDQDFLLFFLVANKDAFNVDVIKNDERILKALIGKFKNIHMLSILNTSFIPLASLFNTPSNVNIFQDRLFMLCVLRQDWGGAALTIEDREIKEYFSNFYNAFLRTSIVSEIQKDPSLFFQFCNVFTDLLTEAELLVFFNTFTNIIPPIFNINTSIVATSANNSKEIAKFVEAMPKSLWVYFLNKLPTANTNTILLALTQEAIIRIQTKKNRSELVIRMFGEVMSAYAPFVKSLTSILNNKTMTDVQKIEQIHATLTSPAYKEDEDVVEILRDLQLISWSKEPLFTLETDESISNSFS